MNNLETLNYNLTDNILKCQHECLIRWLVTIKLGRIEKNIAKELKNLQKIKI